MLKANDQIGPYTLVRQLGRGAFGIVWLAERRGRLATTQVALKLILEEEPDIEALTQEAQLWVNSNTKGSRYVAFSPNDEIVAAVCDNRMVRLWRVSDAVLLNTLSGHEANTQ